MNFNLDLAIITIFLIGTLLIGLKREYKISSFKDFAVGNKSFNTSSLVATLVATWLSGSFLFTSLSKFYSEGITMIVAYSFYPLQLLILNYFFIPKMGEFIKDMSIADSMKRLFGKEAEIITSITGTINCLGITAVQFKVFGSLFSYFFDIDPTYSLILCSAIVIIYSTLGGIRSVTVTDIVQFSTFTIFLPILLFLIVKDLNINYIVDNIGNSHFTNFNNLIDFNDPKYYTFLSIIFYLSLPNFNPALYQRIIIAKSLKQLNSVFNISFIIAFSIVIFITIISICLYYTDSNIAPHNIFSFIIDNYLFTGFKGLTIIGIIAIIMSTADSNLNSSAVLLTEFHHSFFKFNTQKGIFLARLYTVLLGSIGLLLATSSKDIWTIILSTASFYTPIVTTTLMFAILGFHTTKLAALSGMAAAFLTSLIFLILNISYNAIFFATFANIIFLFGTHYLLKQPGGWQKVKLIKPEEDDNGISASIIETLKNFSLKKYLLAELPKQSKVFFGLGLLCFINISYSIYNLSFKLNIDGPVLIISYILGLLLSSYFIFYSLLPKYLRQQKLNFWLVSLIILLICSALSCLLSNYSQLSLALYFVTLSFFIYFCHWQTITLITLVINSLLFICDASFITYCLKLTDFITGQALILIYCSIVNFLKPGDNSVSSEQITKLENKIEFYNQRINNQEKEIERLGATSQRILNNLNHELRIPIGNVMNFAGMLKNSLQNYSEDQLKTLTDEVFKNSNRLSTMLLNMLDLATLEVKKVDLNKEQVNLTTLIAERVKSCQDIYLDSKKQLEFKLNLENDVIVNIDKNYIQQTIDNLVINSITHSKSGLITIDLKLVGKFIEFTITDQGDGIAKAELYDIFTPFKMGSKHETPTEGRGVGLALCKAAIEAHNGTIKAESNGTKGVQFKFLLPK